MNHRLMEFVAPVVRWNAMAYHVATSSVLNILHAEIIPKCCVDSRWTMGVMSAFPPIRKSSMYDYS
jgi:hypothetical protein